MVFTIVKYPDPVLSRPARRIEKGELDLHQLYADMVETMDAAHGIGLAAPQVGKGIRFIVAQDLAGRQTLGLANPRIVEFSATKEVGNEGCLSFPDVWGDVERSISIVVRYQDLDFKPREERFSGHFARVLQHEIDHLNGVLLIDRAIDGLHPADEEPAESEETPGEADNAAVGNPVNVSGG
jgi:peptide deformylase